MTNFDVVVIGAGPSGIYAATYAALKHLKVLVVEAARTVGGQPRQLYGHKKVYDFPGHLVTSGEAIVQNLLRQQADVADLVSYRTGTTVAKCGILKSGKVSLLLSDGSRVRARAAVIATGNGSLVPNRIDPNLLSPDFDLARLHYHVREFSAYAGKDVVILGGGDGAVEWAGQIAAAQTAKSVAIVHRKPVYRANPKYVAELGRLGVAQHLDKTVLGIGRDAIRIADNGTKKTASVAYDEIIVQYGLRQERGRGGAWDFLDRRGSRLTVDRNQQTSAPNVYAIGAATFYDGRPDLMVVGIAEAAVAVKHIYDKINPYGQDYIVKD